MSTFSYRLSRPQRIIENTFGILVSRKLIEGKVELVEKIVLAATTLHNYLQQTHNAHYTTAGFVDFEDKTGAIMEGQWRKLIDTNLQSERPIRNSCYAKKTLQIEKS